ncbi:POTRA domain-containing protein [Buttiauxella agrestis]
MRLQVDGLSGELQKNVRAQLSTIQSDEVTPDRRFRARVDDAIRNGLKALGYYEPTIDFDLRPPPAKGRQVLIAKVDPGPPVLIGGTDVILRGGARDDKDYIALLGERPKIGTVLNHHDYDSFKKISRILRCAKVISTASSPKASSVCRSSAVRRSGISITTAASVTVLVPSPLKVPRFVKNICKTWCRLSRAIITSRKTWLN